jgi:hypothetical protein
MTLTNSVYPHTNSSSICNIYYIFELYDMKCIKWLIFACLCIYSIALITCLTIYSSAKSDTKFDLLWYFPNH